MGSNRRSVWTGRKLRPLLLATVVILVGAACEPANGTDYGWTHIYGTQRSTCGSEEITGVQAGGNYPAHVRGTGYTWLEPNNQTDPCRASSETGARFLANEGFLGNSVRTTENGVTCAFNAMSYNGADAYLFVTVANCPHTSGTDEYRSQVVHRWWDTGAGNYLQATRNSPIINL